ncbi:hypothetical protein [Chloroflexus sp.]|uniref:hypothetical protein n=1 Tax=Chloroflexus sp. TaxID=1904827 RepID=UPI00298F081B|nr:hypothetical protein [Chloroflexus sp.]MDW8405540.1 hypothetical protein [Chloroflexus sp.]
MLELFATTNWLGETLSELPITSFDEKYRNIFAQSIRTCLEYRPKFGKSSETGLSLADFQQLYAQDLFYHWLGLNSPLMYAAHKAAGGITSIYRQVGMACQDLFRQMLQDHLSLSPDQTVWQYEIPAASGKPRQLALDARVEWGHITDEQKRQSMQQWLTEAGNVIKLKPSVIERLRGAVFEVRQGYKSKDAKRQNADIANAIHAYAEGYLPVIILFSQQIDNDIAHRYRKNSWLILIGVREGTATTSTYSFCREIIGYNVADFFDRNAEYIRVEIENVLQKLLAPD